MAEGRTWSRRWWGWRGVGVPSGGGASASASAIVRVQLCECERKREWASLVRLRYLADRAQLAIAREDGELLEQIRRHRTCRGPLHGRHGFDLVVQRESGARGRGRRLVRGGRRVAFFERGHVALELDHRLVELGDLRLQLGNVSLGRGERDMAGGGEGRAGGLRLERDVGSGVLRMAKGRTESESLGSECESGPTLGWPRDALRKEGRKEGRALTGGGAGRLSSSSW